MLQIVLKVSPDVVDIRVFCCLFVVCIYVCSAGYVELLILLYLIRCLVYHMLSKTRRNSRSLHRVIAYICYIYFDAWCITYCWGISARSAGGVRFHTACIFNTVSINSCSCCSCLSHLFMASPDVVDIGCEYFVFYLSCVYICPWLCRATCSLVSAWMLGISHTVQNEKFWNLHRVIGEVLVLGLLVVVYKIPYSSCMWTRQDVIGVFPSLPGILDFLLGTWSYSGASRWCYY